MNRKDTRTSRPSKIIRVNEDVLISLADYYEKYGSWSKALRYYITDNKAKPSWTLPSFIFNTKSQANGESLKRAVQSNVDPESREQPIQVLTKHE